MSPGRCRLGLLLAATLIAVVPTSAQQPIYDRFIKVTPPIGWSERRAWEMGDDRSLPIYNRQIESVVFVWGFDHPLYPNNYLQFLGSGEDRLARRLEMDLSQWPPEVSRYYAMLASGPTVRTTKLGITVGPSFRPAKVKYLGNIRAGKTKVELVQYESEDEVTPKFAQEYKLAPEFVHTHLQVLFGQVMLDQSHGYTLTACRFAAGDDLQWIQPLLEAIQAVPARERQAATSEERARDLVSHAAQLAGNMDPYNRPAEALAALEPVLRSRPDDDNALTIKGEVLLREGKLQDAKSALEAALRRNPDNERAHAALARVLIEENRTEQAQAEITTVGRLSPLYPEMPELQDRLRSHNERSGTRPEP
jgi:tetratricopeptide (TPR) repeat protein